MSSAANQARKDAIRDNVLRPSRNVPYPSKDGKPIYTSEFFGESVFGLAQIAKALPKPAYAQFLRKMRGGQALDKSTADAIAHAVRIWAMDKGATHFTHWFQPQTGTTAEKHDAFLTLKTTHGQAGLEEVKAIDAFSGTQLLQAEPDASSFPSGGMRTTFEARGYTVWDTTSPMFVQHGPHKTTVLYIPSIFISYNGDALDEKTVLLRSTEQVAKAALAVLALLEPVPQGVPPQTSVVYTTLGTEQEYFLVDRALYVLRPDLKITGRTLVGALPAKHQQMEDHYFGHIPSRVLATMSEAELELYKLGVPIKTRHNEVAPQQFELAPIFEETSLAVDHNLLTMDVLSKIAHRNNLKVLFHEKPFKGVNGSGKHCNWSLSTGSGENLLDPTIKPETNYRFLLFLLATLDAVQRHGGLLRAGIASASNEHRLGANEAPPAIISAFLGEHLTEVLDSIEESRPVKNFSVPNMRTIKLGGTALDVMVSTLPDISRDLTDRNRTSPFAFTGNKFEFRAVGSKQSPSFPMTLLNAAVASSLQDVAEALRKAAGDKSFPSDADKLKVIRQYIASTKSVRFEGDNYSDDWKKEAAKRGLLNITNCPDAFDQIVEEKNSAMLCKLGIFSKSELSSRHYILMERYSKDLLLEANTLRTILAQQILPAAFEYRAALASSCAQQQAIKLSAGPELKTLNQTTPLVESLQEWIDKLDDAINKVHLAAHDPSAEARASAKHLLPAMEGAREVADELEEIIADKYFPLPKMSELLWF
ncbi:MAG: glutamine synthetase type III N terminal-domain-containing protein [Linnemannia elongata]|nr:MAG: glutamine synthetase type III N terminal-domain-containing protein [Linnemannia elongata]